MPGTVILPAVHEVIKIDVGDNRIITLLHRITVFIAELLDAVCCKPVVLQCHILPVPGTGSITDRLNTRKRRIHCRILGNQFCRFNQFLLQRFIRHGSAKQPVFRKNILQHGISFLPVQLRLVQHTGDFVDIHKRNHGGIRYLEEIGGFHSLLSAEGCVHRSIPDSEAHARRYLDGIASAAMNRKGRLESILFFQKRQCSKTRISIHQPVFPFFFLNAERLRMHGMEIPVSEDFRDPAEIGRLRIERRFQGLRRLIHAAVILFIQPVKHL